MKKLSSLEKESLILNFLKDGDFYPEFFTIKNFEFLKDPKVPNSVELLISSLLVQGKIFRVTLQGRNYLGLSKDSCTIRKKFKIKFNILNLTFMVPLK